MSLTPVVLLARALDGLAMLRTPLLSLLDLLHGSLSVVMSCLASTRALPFCASGITLVLRSM